MIKKDGAKKLLVLLVVLVALSLVVDLLSLNVLYGITNDEGLSGELASHDLNCERECNDRYLAYEIDSEGWSDCITGCTHIDPPPPVEERDYHPSKPLGFPYYSWVVGDGQG